MEKQLTKLTFENYGNTMSWETPYNDVPIDEIIHAFYSLLVGATYTSEGVIEALGRFAEDYGYVQPINM